MSPLVQVSLHCSSSDGIRRYNPLTLELVMRRDPREGSTVAFFSAPGGSHNEGQYNIDVGFELSVLVKNLVSDHPKSIPPGAPTVVMISSDENFNDKMSTVRFL